jgi:hypothetical protein
MKHIYFYNCSLTERVFWRLHSSFKYSEEILFDTVSLDLSGQKALGKAFHQSKFEICHYKLNTQTLSEPTRFLIIKKILQQLEKFETVKENLLFVYIDVMEYEQHHLEELEQLGFDNLF